jgi:hypothetical protein
MGEYNNSNTNANQIDYFVIQTLGNASDFGDATVAGAEGTAATSGAAS